MYVESNSRAVVKAFTWRFSATIATAAIVYIFTGSFGLAFTVGGLEFIAKMALYYVHERAWNKVGFGKREVEPAVFWLTGYSGSGKKPLANALQASLEKRGLKVEILAGDSIRQIFEHVGYTAEERDRHVRRVGYLASMLEKQGVVVIVSMTSPFKESRAFARKLCKNFVEVYVSTPIEHCETRDPKGLWKKARSGEVKDFVGVDIGYESPISPEFTLDLTNGSYEQSAEQIVSESIN